MLPQRPGLVQIQTYAIPTPDFLIEGEQSGGKFVDKKYNDSQKGKARTERYKNSKTFKDYRNSERWKELDRIHHRNANRRQKGLNRDVEDKEA